MPAHLRSATTATFFLALFIGGTSAATAADDLKGIVCPPNKPYCIQKPALTQEEIDEARKAQVRAAANYRDPASIDLCPPSRYAMDGFYGCRPIARR